MLESVSERLMDTVHAGSPTKDPRCAGETIRAAGELKIPFTSGILVGVGESEQERLARSRRSPELHTRYGHLQEVILQNFVPAPELLRAGAGRDRDASARQSGDAALAPRPPAYRCPTGPRRSRSGTSSG